MGKSAQIPRRFWSSPTSCRPHPDETFLGSPHVVYVRVFVVLLSVPVGACWSAGRSDVVVMTVAPVHLFRVVLWKIPYYTCHYNFTSAARTCHDHECTLCLYVSIMAKKNTTTSESDSAYFLKLVLYVLLGSFWLRFATPIEIGYVTLNGFPIGLLLGLLFASHDHFQIDRKIEYAILVIVTIITFFLPAGIVL
jgi:hypothetical protein